MEYLRQLPDKSVDLAIVDPPYGISTTRGGNGSRRRIYDRSNKNAWDETIPSDEYFDQLFRVSKHYIIWGGNYFPKCAPMQNFIVWDKKQPDGVTFAQAELAATNLPGKSKIFRGVARSRFPRIHPTQKPVALYEWLFDNFAPAGGTVLDTHLGSGSSALVAFKRDVQFVGIEINPEYYNAAKERFAAYANFPACLKPIELPDDLKL